MRVTEGREPKAFFEFFEQISAIPRMSHHEEAIADYLVEFAKSRGLEHYRDSYQNVLIRKPATKGYEDRPSLLLQGHTDMVCEKNGGVEHDFFKDPLKLYVDGDYLRAKDTTLGADDGIAVSTMLAALDGAFEAHPALECLFTATEEVGLIGAIHFDYSLIRSKRMINLDSNVLGEIVAGCAGGIRSDLTLPVNPIPFEGHAVRIAVSGLAGGHSGENIHEGRANANKLMGRLLADAVKACGASLVSVNGGTKDNAIPRECEAVIAVSDADAAIAVLTDTAEHIAQELVALDRGFTVSCEETGAEAFMLDRRDTDRVVGCLYGLAVGVFAMNRDIEGLVEYSRNLGIVRTNFEEICFSLSSRSSMESRLDASVAELDAWMRMIGGSARHHSRYPGWQYAAKSPLRDAYAKAYRETTGKDVSVNVIHAGLECGIVYANVPGIDIISISPDLFNLHAPDEALYLPSVAVFWQTLVALFKQ